MPAALELVNSVKKLLTLPHVYLRVKTVMEDPNASMVDMAKVISGDPALTVRLLKVVNSSFYAFGGRVETITRALSILGTQQVHDLVLATSVASAFARLSPNVMSMEAFWRHSVYCALGARSIAKRCNVLDSERLFVEGLLSDIGHLVMYQAIPELAARALETAARAELPLHQVERDIIGCHFAEVGAELMHSWSLPASIEGPVRYHAEPALGADHAFEASILHLARQLSLAAASNAAVDAFAASVDAQAWHSTGLTSDCYAVLRSDIDGQVGAVVSIFYPAQQMAA
jgi:HD-like signal output (HDOD) protein